MKVSELYTTDLHDAGSEVEILSEQSEPTGFFITVAGLDSKVFREQTKIQQKKYLEAYRKGKDFDDEDLLIDGLVATTISWRGTDEKFSKKLCKELYVKAPYVKDQVDRFIGDRENFIKAKPKK